MEPVGIEHTNEEIADIALLAKDCDVIVSGAMARIPVEGTPLGAQPQISDERLAQIIAVTRLLGGRKVPDICVHPYSRQAADFGANVTVIETGSVPRDSCCCSGGKWNQFDVNKAKKSFEEAWLIQSVQRNREKARRAVNEGAVERQNAPLQAGEADKADRKKKVCLFCRYFRPQTVTKLTKKQKSVCSVRNTKKNQRKIRDNQEFPDKTDRKINFCLFCQLLYRWF